MREGALNIRQGSLEGNIVIAYAVTDVAKENSKKAAKNMTEAEADSIKMISKTTEAEEAPMRMETRQGALNTRQGALGGDIVITYTVADVVKENMKKAAKKMTEAEAGALKML